MISTSPASGIVKECVPSYSHVKYSDIPVWCKVFLNWKSSSKPNFSPTTVIDKIFGLLAFGTNLKKYSPFSRVKTWENYPLT